MKTQLLTCACVRIARARIKKNVMDFIEKMFEMHEKAAYVRSVFSPISERTFCTSDKYPDCFNCFLGCALEFDFTA